MVFEYRHQPFKALYLAYQTITTLLFRYPLWALYYLFRRPRPTWTFSRSFKTALRRHEGNVFNKIGPPSLVGPNHKAIVQNLATPGIWIEPILPPLLLGEIKTYAEQANVQPIRIPGYWLHSTSPSKTVPAYSPPTPGEKVIMALHGGAYTKLSAAPGADGTTNIVKGFLEHVPSVKRTFSVEYRLSIGEPYKPENPFPAVLIDALAGYVYLTKTAGFDPKDIIIEGDSAGANLVLALTRYLVQYGADGAALGLPPPPSAIILLSPWADLGGSHNGPGTSHELNAHSDFLANKGEDGIGYSARAFVQPFGESFARTSPWISPASLHIKDASFAGFPPTFINAGGAEKLLDAIKTLNLRMRQSGVKVTYDEAPDGFHDYVGFDWFEPERTETLKRIAKWVEAN
ncbi:alpha/beta-hydrolase [Punctularia strigosozonata HHB-11173 SS5]|uniref:alpha/beta-hydrolase n=1 Tax=Punctularia strigosozonata (strain HHB-11173) TaxID=741275 RepID=UPI000441678A|nr:alpha/beta-hydrolase [Punctularia strigosozonata HHB-11173 SS5]EIN08324.1 alpha/beta-hydrolase [Punctularia strigosozonata HHB-11173 SS5]